MVDDLHIGMHGGIRENDGASDSMRGSGWELILEKTDLQRLTDDLKCRVYDVFDGSSETQELGEKMKELFESNKYQTLFSGLLDSTENNPEDRQFNELFVSALQLLNRIGVTPYYATQEEIHRLTEKFLLSHPQNRGEIDDPVIEAQDWIY